ncbi:16S rRNA (uracil(1498)-N(3))-methyltransferase [Sutcliffiella rhizosphaerae]|uniref:Ribosomal RNA small subunit methyltransferase E n=1 Tax=Sutcliffiella rhizosphaerae TaxID=2880967 RepID=A0ABM8YHS4_9BACI|nr:16S rRNA (uracil(1498)-N(3))-methyltransferase [Sutcliffiella rhizosphaerae]CAG9619369.1 Ribosomal RNA small subunit methyltransferase E [Sutcliffiella rhizosphaerae]
MQRYFVKNDQVNESSISITGEDVHHIVRVMRMNVGDDLLCSFSEIKKTAQCKIVEITNESVVVDIVEWIETNSEMPVRVTIGSGLPKGDKLELVIQKGTELGAESFIPFNAARSIVKLDEKKGKKKAERWNKIAKEAAEQSHRTVVPNVSEPASFSQLLEKSRSYDHKIVAYEESAKDGEKAAFAHTLQKLKHGESLLCIFGPEGGLSEKEIEKLKEYGFICCALGPRILRTETAPLFTLAAISYHLELM